MNITLSPVGALRGEPVVPGDKSISHRALILGSMASGETRIHGILESGDLRSTWKCLEYLGIRIKRENDCIAVEGKGIWGFQPPTALLDCENSGTTMRLMMGALAGRAFSCTLIGDHSLSRRPMKRVAQPLIRMGAKIDLEGNSGDCCPVQIHAMPRNSLHAISYELPISSAQLKSALLLAGLRAEGQTVLTGKMDSRDHTERMLTQFGVKIQMDAFQITLEGGQSLSATEVKIPSDFSSAAFWISAALIVPGTVLELKNISLNPSRTGLLTVLARMGAKIETEVTTSEPEPSGTLRIYASALQATTVTSDEIPFLLDEIPLLSVLATFAEGTTRVMGASELRTKETDRIETTAINLRLMGARVDTFSDGLSIPGVQKLSGAKLNSYGDHRIAMAFAIAALRAEGSTEIENVECVEISYPSFFKTLEQLTQL